MTRVFESEVSWPPPGYLSRYLKEQSNLGFGPMRRRYNISRDSANNTKDLFLLIKHRIRDDTQMLALSPNALYGVPSRTFLAALILASIIGCGRFESGGGSRTVLAGGTNTEAVYGFGEGKKLGFVMFTDIPSEGTVASAGSTWTGRIAPKKGQAVDYKGSADGLDINGTEYKFANGRVFLVSCKDDNISVSQLKVPIGDASYDSEIDRIAKTADVQAFLSK